MIDVKKILENVEGMKANLLARGIDFDLDRFISLYEDVKSRKQKLEDLQRRLNAISKIKKEDSLRKSSQLELSEASSLKGDIISAKEYYNSSLQEFTLLSRQLPNWTSPDVPVGRDDEDNLTLRVKGIIPEFEFSPKDHVQLGKELDLIDFESGTKVSGSKFYFLKNQAVFLQHALKAFIFNKALKAGFTPLQTPDISHNHILEGVGFAPRGDESNTYGLDGLDKSLIATAEICVAGMHAGTIIDGSNLPLLYIAESHCFRREAGASGRSSKGLYRVHQFEKLEFFVICKPEDGDKYHEIILALQEEIYSELGIPYKVVVNCTGDLGAPAYKKYDIEAWMPGKGVAGEYGEITSASNCTDYQARRLDIKYKDPVSKNNQYVYTLNGTASALGRTMVAILENYQRADGSVEVPEPLRRHLDFDQIVLTSSPHKI
ncbi:seryl-tRNA synthetase [Pseudomonas sp. NFACC23-1]|uniref:serine--tRNA ligase n=1 Tax=unclassified Pseudomonas TaxID=196821 RepID=UPI000880BD27|nr:MULTISPECIES: serine--tRNA ligase [unclassified Pseudomonas]SDB67520.1 seryl-tRNA synthetase [Pseudomonas sp. NFACC17-2]SEJ99631.1 seryl-tRNA synthetase [Pseudomonas sp. NFACC23-1]SFW92883.1 seryl-tRNA synthetase [Pseudomonas sp. NFACC16-2]